METFSCSQNLKLYNHSDEKNYFVIKILTIMEMNLSFENNWKTKNIRLFQN